ncbi:MAG: hypothetical protein SO424_01345 [[Pasteurella] aerogenes]|nr:hypothetical protein [[Pasteurella] aerogenes]
MENEKKVEKSLNELRKLLETVGWSRRELAKKVAIKYPEKDDYREYERIKKMFNRPPKKTDQIEYYIGFILEHTDNKKLHFYKLPTLEVKDKKESEFLKGIAEISAEFFDKYKQEK